MDYIPVFLVLFIDWLCCRLPIRRLSQTTVTVNVQDATLSDVLWEIQRQTDFTFIYSTNDVKNVKVRNLRVTNGKIAAVLDECLKNSGLAYVVKDGAIAIRPANEVNAVKAVEQANVISGTVVDETGEPVIGANVLVKGTTNGQITDLNGGFSIKVEHASATLLVSYVGYVRQEVKATSGKILKIVLVPDANMMEEVVVTGYGTFKKSAYAGSAASVKNEKIADVPSVSFFTFCKEMLDKYEQDTRITMIAGFNNEEITPDVPYDYFFASTFSIWGWASWKRVIDQWDEHYTFLEDKFNMQQLEQLIKERKFRKDFIYMCHRHKENNKAYYETIFHASMLFNSGLSIVPTRNMINNLGATADSTHFAGSVHTMPRGYRRIFTMKRYEVEFPLKHPRYVIENVAYKKAVYRIMGWGHPWIKIGRSFEELFLNLRYGNFSIITKAIKNRINKWLKRDQHR